MRVPEFSGLGQTYPIPASYSPTTYPRKSSYSPVVYPWTFGDLGGPVFLGKFGDSLEKSLGDNSEGPILKEMGGAVTNKSAVTYVDRIGQALVVKSRRPKFGYKFGIVNDKEPNAFALPNGSIYVTVGLLGLLKNEAQLAHVLGHEIAHVTERHSLAQMEVNLGTGLALAIASSIADGKASEDDLKKANEFVFGLVSNGYSRKDESESDYYGQKLAALSGWDPSGMVDVMKIFLSLEKTKPEGIDAFMRSHPYSGDRVEEATKRLPGLPRGKTNEAEYQRFIGALTGTTPVRSAVDYENGAKDGAKDASDSITMPLIFVGGAAAILLVVLLKK